MLANWGSLMRLFAHRSCQLQEVDLDNVGGPSRTEALAALSVLTAAAQVELEDALDHEQWQRLLSTTRPFAAPLRTLKIGLTWPSSPGLSTFWAAFLLSCARRLQDLTLSPLLASSNHMLVLLLDHFDALDTLTIGDGPAVVYYSFNDMHSDYDDSWLDDSDAGDSAYPADSPELMTASQVLGQSQSC